MSPGVSNNPHSKSASGNAEPAVIYVSYFTLIDLNSHERHILKLFLVLFIGQLDCQDSSVPYATD
eukprot:scaffold610_cov204-Chaetoceros_neogracile.AAC.1